MKRHLFTCLAFIAVHSALCGAYGGIIFTGDVERDFSGSNVSIFPDFIGDVGIPAVAAPGTISGWDIKDVRISYDLASNTMFFGLNFRTNVGDADGDGNAATFTNPGGIGGTDWPLLGPVGGGTSGSGGEAVALAIDTDQDGLFDIVVGDPAGNSTVSGIIPLSTYNNAGGPTTNHGTRFGTPITGAVATAVINPDFEIRITNWSSIDSTPFAFNFGAFAGSFDDAGFGEDNFNGTFSATLGVDTPAILQLLGSAVPMNLAVGQAAANIHDVSGRTLNRRISRLRQRRGCCPDRSNVFDRRASGVSSSRLNGEFKVASTVASAGSTGGSFRAGSASEKANWGASLFPAVTQQAKHSADPDVVAAGRNWAVFASADFGQYDLNPLGGARGLESNTAASTAGIEYVINKNLAVGAGWSHTVSDNTLGSDLGGFDIDGDSAMAYLSYFKNNLWGDMFYSFGDYNVDIRRNSLLGSTVTANPDLESHQTTLNLGYNIPCGRLVHGPTFRSDYGWGRLEGYTETGDLRANTIFREQDYGSLITTLGWQINWETETTFGAKMRPNFRLGYGRENIDQETNVSGTLQQSPFVLITNGAVAGRGAAVTNSLSQVDPGEGWMEAGVGVGFDFCNGLGLYFDYQGRFFQDDAQLHLGTVKAGLKW